MEAVDHLVSGKSFEIWECSKCNLRFTQQVPGPEQIGKYYKSEQYVSHSETQKGIINRLYHYVRSLTLADKRRLILSTTQLDKGGLLDIGSGTGAFVHYMKTNGWSITGLEPDESARLNARQLHQVDLDTPEKFFSFPDESFDAITMWHVLEHVHTLHEYMDQLKKLIRPTGKIFIAVPNYLSFDASFYKNNWAAYDVPRHLYHFSESSMFELLERHGLKLSATRPMWYDSFYISMLSEKYISGKGNLARSIGIGFLSNLMAFVDKERCSSLTYVITK
jgi:2-polyprenyl-3-methyl-5-hydroxy-6-metoxy-1,4-benzoquinol methylase